MTLELIKIRALNRGSGKCRLTDVLGQEPSMIDIQHGRDDGVLFIKARHMQAAQAKWDRLTAGDLSQIKDQDQLIDRVSDRYSLPRAQAQTDVVTWVSLIKEPPGETPSKP
jgi:hypothetical protein